MSLPSLATPRLSRQPSNVVVVSACLAIGLALGAAVTFATPLYAIGGLVGLVGLVLLLASLEIALLALIGVLTIVPFFVVPVPIGGVRLTLLDICLVVLLLWLVRIQLQPDLRFRGSVAGPAVLLFLGLACVSFAIGLGYSTSPETMRLFLKWLNSTLLFFTIVNLVQTERRAVMLVRAFLLGVAASGAIGVLLYVAPRDLAIRAFSLLRPFGYPPAAEMIRTIADTEILRAVGTSIDPNVFGAMLMIGAAMGVTQLRAHAPIFPRWVVLVLLAPTCLALLLTYSRGSWVGLAAGLAVLAVFRERRLWLIAVAMAAALALGILPQESQFLSHLESGFAARDRAAAMRLGEYKDAFILISRYPLFGVGFGQAPDVDIYVGVSSIYLLIAENTGVLGLAAYVGSLGLIGGRALLEVRRPGSADRHDLLLGGVVGLVAALCAGVFDHHFANVQFPHMVALLWMTAGLTTTLTDLATERRGDVAEHPGFSEPALAMSESSSSAG